MLPADLVDESCQLTREVKMMPGNELKIVITTHVTEKAHTHESICTTRVNEVDEAQLAGLVTVEEIRNRVMKILWASMRIVKADFARRVIARRAVRHVTEELYSAYINEADRVEMTKLRPGSICSKCLSTVTEIEYERGLTDCCEAGVISEEAYGEDGPKI
jgi:hypothetical protein